MVLPRRWIAVSLALGLVLLVHHTRADEGNSSWRYVVPESTESGFTSPALIMPLSEQRPEAIKSEPPARGGKRSYALLRYGSPSSPLMPMVLDERDGGELDLTIDLSRSGEMGDARPIAGNGRTRQLEIKSAIPHKDRASVEFPRQVLIRKSASGKSLSVATLGYLAGSVTVGDTTVAARRVDGNANGLFADPQDRLWLDLNADGKFDPFDEQFPFGPVLSVGGKRYAARSDEVGMRLALEEITGTGKISVRLASLTDDYELKELELSLAARDGSVYSARGSGGPLEVPPGQYATRALELLLVNRQSGERWYFVFSRFEDPREQDWHEVAVGKDIAIDPVGKLDFRLEGAALDQKIPAGTDFRIEPGLYTQDGMQIRRCDDGNPAAGLSLNDQGRCAHVVLAQTNGTAISQHTSGFG
jgi:hypothetical protein